MSVGIRLLPEELRSLPYTSTSGSYVVIGGAFSHPLIEFYLINNTNAPLYFSLDGITDHIYLLAGAVFPFFSATGPTKGGTPELGSGTAFYVRRDGVTAPTSGIVALSAFYLKEK